MPASGQNGQGVWVELGEGAAENGFAVMMADLVRQNLEAKPHKRRDFEALDADVAIVVEDADVALTMRFRRGRLTIEDGVFGVPDATIRGDADSVIAMSNVPLSRRFGLPWASPKDAASMTALKGFVSAIREGRVHMHARLGVLPMMARLTRVMSVHG